MSPIIIRDLPPKVEALLLERARREGRSLCEVATSLLAAALGAGTNPEARASPLVEVEGEGEEGLGEDEMWL
jgi:hypothetical protein